MSSKFQPGSTIQITGLQTEAHSHLNGLEGVVEKYSLKREKYKVVLPQGPVMVSESNMKAVGSIFSGEEEMMQRLKSMGMSAEQLGNLTAEQRKAMLAMTMRPDIIERAKDTPGVMSTSKELKMEKDGLYGWRDAKTHVYLEMSVDEEKTGVQCVIDKDRVCVSSVATGATLLEGALFQSVDTAKCVWEVTQGKLIATLTKEKPMRWVMVLQE